jgi:two-component system, LytTR family, response regulator
MTAIRVVAVDDEPLARERVTTLVRETEGLDLVGEGNNGIEALDLIARLDPDLVFIDVEMPELSGFGVIAALDGVRTPGTRVPAVVFITAFEQYALQAFEVGAVDYLQKPVTRQRFGAAVARAKERLDRRSAEYWQALVTGASLAERARGVRTRFVVRRGTTHHIVPADQVDWLEVADNYLTLHVGAKTHLWRGTMKQAEEELDAERFVRIHRSVIVAIDRIVTVKSHESGGHVIALRSGVQLRSSRQYADRVRALLR